MKVKGRKQHGVVDVLGNLLTVVVHTANQSGTIAGGDVLAKALQKHKTIKAFSEIKAIKGQR